MIQIVFCYSYTTMYKSVIKAYAFALCWPTWCQDKYRYYASIDIFFWAHDVTPVPMYCSICIMLCSMQPTVCIGSLLVYICDVSLVGVLWEGYVCNPACIGSVLVYVLSKLLMWWGNINIGLIHPSQLALALCWSTWCLSCQCDEAR